MLWNLTPAGIPVRADLSALQVDGKSGCNIRTIDLYIVRRVQRIFTWRGLRFREAAKIMFLVVGPLGGGGE